MYCDGGILSDYAIRIFLWQLIFSGVVAKQRKISNFYCSVQKDLQQRMVICVQTYEKFEDEKFGFRSFNPAFITRILSSFL